VKIDFIEMNAVIFQQTNKINTHRDLLHLFNLIIFSALYVISQSH